MSVADRLLDADFLAEHGPFDAAVLSDVLEHLSTPAELMRLVMSELKPAGWCSPPSPT